MIKNLLIIILTLFQDNFVRIGTILGALIGLWSSDILQINSTSNLFTFGFIGWGIGAYLGNFSKNINKPSKKFRLFKGGKK